MNYTIRQLEDLAESGISPDLAQKCGLLNITDPRDSALILNISGMGPTPALGFPYFSNGDPSKSQVFIRLKPDDPWENSHGKLKKYLQPKGVKTDIYVPLNLDRTSIADIDVPLYLLEGEKKAIAMNASGFLAVAAPGVFNFISSAEDGSKIFRPSLNIFPIKRRRIYVFFDASMTRNMHVLKAAACLCEVLKEKGAEPYIVLLVADSRVREHLIDMKDFKVDDYLVKYSAQELQQEVINYSLPWPLFRVSERFDELTDRYGESLFCDIVLKFHTYIGDAVEKSKLQNVLKKKFHIPKGDINLISKNHSQNSRRMDLEDFGDRYEEHTNKRLIDWGSERTYDAKWAEILGILNNTGKAYRIGNLPVYIGKNSAKYLSESKLFIGFIMEFITFSEQDKVGNLTYPLPSPTEMDIFLNHEPTMSGFQEILTVIALPVYDSDLKLVSSGFNERDRIYFVGDPIEPSYRFEYLKQLMDDICFANDGSSDNFLGSLLSSLFPAHFIGDKPMTLLQGNQRGLGKTTVAQTSAIIRSGAFSKTISYNPNDEEFEKQLASLVREGATQIVIDNAKISNRAPEISSATLERSITDSILNFRLLGQNKLISVPNTHDFTLTANSPKLSPDLISRSLPVNLHYEGDSSELKFAILDPKAFALKNLRKIRAELIGMVEVWKEKGMPECQKEFRFRKFTRMIGGILEANGFSSFLDNRKSAEVSFSSEFSDIQELFFTNPDLNGKPKVFAEKAASMGLFKGELSGFNGSGKFRAMATILSRYVGKTIPLENGQSGVLEAKMDSHDKSNHYSLLISKPATEPSIAKIQVAISDLCGDAETKQTSYAEANDNLDNKVEISGCDAQSHVGFNESNSSVEGWYVEI